MKKKKISIIITGLEIYFIAIIISGIYHDPLNGFLWLVSTGWIFALFICTFLYDDQC